MREIKFRAWDLERKKMYDVQGINWYDREVHYSYSDAWREGYSIGEEQNLDKVILMQFTALRDKDGKEIYEEDIIKGYLNSKWDANQKTWIAEEYLLGKVVYNAEQGVYGIKHDGYLYRASSDCDLAIKTSLENYLPLNYFVELEVVGNIFENPDLLKNKNKIF